MPQKKALTRDCRVINMASTKKQNKTWADLSLKEKVGGIVGILVILFLLIMLKGLIFGGPSDSKTSDTNQTSLSSMSEEDRLKHIATTAATEGDGLAKAVREVRVIPEPDGSFSVNVVFFDDSFRYSTIKQTMGNIYLALFKSNVKLETVMVAVKNEYRNSYGDVQEIIVLQTQLTNEVAQKINYDTDTALLQMKIIPGLWETQKIHDDIKKQL